MAKRRKKEKIIYREANDYKKHLSIDLTKVKDCIQKSNKLTEYYNLLSKNPYVVNKNFDNI